MSSVLIIIERRTSIAMDVSLSLNQKSEHSNASKIAHSSLLYNHNTILAKIIARIILSTLKNTNHRSLLKLKQNHSISTPRPISPAPFSSPSRTPPALSCALSKSAWPFSPMPSSDPPSMTVKSSSSSSLE